MVTGIFHYIDRDLNTHIMLLRGTHLTPVLHLVQIMQQGVEQLLLLSLHRPLVLNISELLYEKSFVQRFGVLGRDVITSLWANSTTR